MDKISCITTDVCTDVIIFIYLCFDNVDFIRLMISSIMFKEFLILIAYNQIYMYPFKTYRLRDAPAGLTFNNCTLCPHSIYEFYIYLRTNIDLCHLHHKLIFITEMKNVYCAVRTGSLNKAVCTSSLKGYEVWDSFGEIRYDLWYIIRKRGSNTHNLVTSGDRLLV
jgi:hypothetical protein